MTALNNIQWIYGDEKLSVRADEKKALVTFVFRYEDVLLVYIDDNEFLPDESCLEGIYVSLSGEFVSLHDLMKQAEKDYPSYKREADDHEAEEAEHAAYVSSPEQTGRV
jgi:hypothetical protein